MTNLLRSQGQKARHKRNRQATGIGPITLGMRAAVRQLQAWSTDSTLTPQQRNIAWRAAVQFPEFPIGRGGGGKGGGPNKGPITRGNVTRSEFLARFTTDPSCLPVLDALIY